MQGGPFCIRIVMPMNEKQQLSDELNRKFIKWRTVNKRFDMVLLAVLLFLIIFIGSALMENWLFNIKGMESIKYHDFNELLEINPDTVAWITLDGTNIDYPVVKGKDNFEYLDKSFTGEFSAGGTLFLDSGNSRDFTDDYNIIHGHHMTNGKMFGDLDKFLDKPFFDAGRTGTLLTPKYDYDLNVIAVGEYDAYDGIVYTAGGSPPLDKILRESLYSSASLDEVDRVLALSTCVGDMSDSRIVVFCRMLNKRRHQ